MNSSDVLNRLTQYRRRQAALVQHLFTRDIRLAENVEGCGSFLRIREWMETGESRIRDANFCKKFLVCTSCAARRAAKQVAAYATKVEAVQAERPELVPAMVTLSIKNRPDTRDGLREGLQHLKDSWRRQSAAARSGRTTKCRNARIEWNKVQGSVRAIEVTNIGNGWHPHIHAFVLLEDYIDQKALSAEWERFTGDSTIVDVRKCRNGIVPGLIETLKYVTKLADLTPEQIYQVHAAAKGSRFTDPQGILRGVPEPEINEDDQEGLSGAWREFIALWAFGTKSYHFQDVADPSKKLGIFKPGDDGFGDLPSAMDFMDRKTARSCVAKGGLGVHDPQ